MNSETLNVEVLSYASHPDSWLALYVWLYRPDGAIRSSVTTTGTNGKRRMPGGVRVMGQDENRRTPGATLTLPKIAPQVVKIKAGVFPVPSSYHLLQVAFSRPQQFDEQVFVIDSPASNVVLFYLIRDQEAESVGWRYVVKDPPLAW